MDLDGVAVDDGSLANKRPCERCRCTNQNGSGSDKKTSFHAVFSNLRMLLKRTRSRFSVA